MANVNDKWSQDAVTPAQRARFNPQSANSAWAASWEGANIEEVQCAHDLQGAPQHLFEAPLDNDASPLAPVEVVDRAAAEERARFGG
jgi:hypothetical protein